MHSTTAESGRFTSSIKTWYRIASNIQRATAQICLNTSQRLSGEDMQLHTDKGSSIGVENSVWFCNAS